MTGHGYLFSVAAGVPPAVEPGFLPGGFSCGCGDIPGPESGFRGARWRPRQPRYLFSVGFRQSGFQTVVARASRPCVGCTIRTGGTPVPLSWKRRGRCNCVCMSTCRACELLNTYQPAWLPLEPQATVIHIRSWRRWRRRASAEYEPAKSGSELGGAGRVPAFWQQEGALRGRAVPAPARSLS